MRVFSAVIFFFAFTISVKSQDTAFREPIAVIDGWLDAQLAYEKIPGIAVAIIKDQQLVWSKGYGFANVEKSLPMKPETLCSICSISKLFTSIAVMQLWEQGKLRLDDSVSMYLPHFRLKQEFETVPITIRGLLTHSAGLPRESAQAYWSSPYTFPTEQEINDKLSEQTTLYPSSREFQYSNLGMTLLGQIVAKVSGMPYEQYIQEKILNPLQMNSTRTFMPKELYGTELAMGYSGVNRQGQRHLMPFFTANGIAPAAGFTSSVIDLGKFLQWQNRLLKTGKAEVLKASTLREMQRVQWHDPEGINNSGLGFEVAYEKGNLLTGHSGGCPGYRSYAVLNTATGVGVVVFINAAGARPEKFVDGIFKILDHYGSTKALPAVPDLSAYTGLYDRDMDWGSEQGVFAWKGRLLIISLPSNDPIGTKPRLYKPTESRDVFRIERKDDLPGIPIRFERDASGKVIRYWLNSNRIEKG
jgi:CubicO group peptidase (beta-lactamase class C family)